MADQRETEASAGEPTGSSSDAERDQFVGALGSSTSLLASRAALMAFAVLANLLAARMLGPSGRGQIAAALQVSYLCSFLVVMGLDRSLAMVAPGISADTSLTAARSVMLKRSVAALIVGGLISMFGLFADQSLLTTFGITVGLMAVFNGHFRVIEASLINADRAASMVPLQILSGATTLVLLGALALGSWSAVGLWFFAYVISSVVVVMAAHRQHTGGGRHPGGTLDKSEWSRAGLRLLPASMAGFATLRSDRLLLPALSGSEELGLYVVVATFVDLASVPIESLANVLLPRWRARQLAGHLSTRKELAFSGALAALLAAGVWVVGSVLVVPVFGQVYERSRSFLPALAVAAFLLGASRLAQSRALALALDKLVSLAETCGVVVAFIAYVKLIPGLGAQGAAIVSIAGYGTTLMVVVLGQLRSSVKA